MARVRNRLVPFVVAGSLVTGSLVTSCGSSGTGPTNTEVVGQVAGLSAVTISDVPTDRDAPATAVATKAGLVVYEDPTLGGDIGDRTARRWVLAPDGGAWSDPLPLDVVDEPLVGLRAVLVDDAVLVVVGQTCPNGQSSGTRGVWRCHDGPSSLVAVVITLSSPLSVVVTTGPVAQTFAADGTVDRGRALAAPVVGWDGTSLVIVSGSGDPTHFDAKRGAFSAGSSTELAQRGIPVECGRPSRLSVGVVTPGTTLTPVAGDVATGVTMTEVRGEIAVPRVIGCSNDAAVVRSTTGSPAGSSTFDLVDFGSGSHASVTAPVTDDSTAIALTGRQAVVVSATRIVIASTDRPLATLADGSYLPSTLTSYGQDSYVLRAGSRLSYTRVINQR